MKHLVGTDYYCYNERHWKRSWTRFTHQGGLNGAQETISSGGWERGIGGSQKQRSGQLKPIFIDLAISLAKSKVVNISGNSHSCSTWLLLLFSFSQFWKIRMGLKHVLPCILLQWQHKKNAGICSEIIPLLGSADQVYHHCPSPDGVATLCFFIFSILTITNLVFINSVPSHFQASSNPNMTVSPYPTGGKS